VAVVAIVLAGLLAVGAKFDYENSRTSESRHHSSRLEPIYGRSSVE
jgi:hypothetical protein